MPVEHAQLLQICAAAKRAAFSTFDSICVAPNSRLRNLLKQHIHDRTHALREQNLDVSRSLAHRDMILQWNAMKDQCSTCVSALETVVTLSTCVSLSAHGPGVWEGLGNCMMDVILPEVISMSRKFDFDNNQERASERDSFIKDISMCRMQNQELGHKVQQLQESNDELVQQRDRWKAEKAAIEESFEAIKVDLEKKTRELQSLQVSSDSAKETLLQQLDVSLKKNTSYAAQVHMLETDVQASNAREAELQSSMKELHEKYRDSEQELKAQLEAARVALEATSGDRQQARLREEDMKVECAVLKERLQHASDAATADLASLQEQLDSAVGKARDAVKSRELVMATMSQQEQQHSEEMRALLIESSQKESALESKLFQLMQMDASIRQQLQEMTDRCSEAEMRLRESEASHQLLVQQHLSLKEVHSNTRAELERFSRDQQEIKSQHDQKMQLLLQESAHNQQQLYELQRTLQKEKCVGQDAILAGTEVLQELARLKLQIEDEAHEKRVASGKSIGGKTGKPKSSLPLFARRDSLKFQQLSSPQTPPH